MREADFPPNEAVRRMLRLNVVLGQEKFVKVPIVLEFKPEGSEDEYMVEADYVWDPEDDKKGPISLAYFSHHRSGPDAEWEEPSPPETRFDLVKLSKPPFGRWRMRIKNGGTNVNGQPINPTNYPGLFANEPPQEVQKEPDTPQLMLDGQPIQVTEIPDQTELDLSWLTDILFAVTYDAKVEYKYAQ